MKISKKKRQDLYDAIHTPIMDIRVNNKIQFPDDRNMEDVDKLLL